MPQVEFKTLFPISGATTLDTKHKGKRFEQEFQHHPHLKLIVTSYSALFSLAPSEDPGLKTS